MSKINENLFITVVSIIAIVAIVCLTFYGGAFAEETREVLLVDENGNVVGQFAIREGGRTVGAGVITEIIK